MRICLLLFSVIISSFILGETALAQEINIYETFKNPDITHKKERPYNDQLAEILMRRKEAIQASNDFKLAQSFYLEMLIKDKIKEDSSFITNSLYIDSLAKTSQNRPALKLSVQLLKAQRIRQYLNLGINIQKRVALSTEKSIRWLQMPEDSLQQEIQSSLYAAKAVLHQIGNYPLSDYLWLSGDPLFFWFKPDLAAIVYGEGINLLHKRFLPQMVMEWLQKKEFPIRIESITDTALAPVLAWHKQWQEKDILNDEQKYFFEIQLTKNLYAGVAYSDSLENLYKNYLQCHITSKFSCVRAFTAFQLFLIDHKNGKSFNSSRGIKADSSHCFAYKNALSIYRAHHQVLDSFFMAKEIILKAVGNIEKKEFTLSKKQIFLPETPPEFSLNYRNIDSIYIRLVPIATKETNFISNKKSWNYYTTSSSILDTVIFTPFSADLNFHTGQWQLPVLKTGNYCLQISYAPIDTLGTIGELAQLQVSQLSIIQHDKDIFVLDRKTGHPVEKASIQVLNKPRKTSKTTANGRKTLSLKEAEDLLIFKGNDSVRHWYNNNQNFYNSEVYSKEDYDYLLEYYEENASCYFYTDRSIYRPGQTVHYKGIILIKDKRTGDPLMLNWNNLQFDPFTKLYLKILQKIKKEKLEIIIKDPFYRTVDSSTIIPNKFGSFSGSFKIPETAATGSYSFDTYPLETNFVQNEFQVEEYKRPSYEIRIDHPKLPYGIGDTIPVKIKLHSFSGAVLNNIPVQVSIEAYGPNMKFPLLKIDTTTNGTGEFIVLLTDPAGKELGDAKNGEYKMEYVVKAKALSPTGEEQEKNYNIQLNKHPILLSHSIPLTLDLATPIQFRLTAQSNYEALPGRLVQYKICRLNGDELLLITDKTDTTDKWIPLETQVMDTGIYQIELFYYKENQLNGYKKSTFKVYNSSKRLFPYTQEDFVETHLHTGRETTIQWIEGFREDSNYCIFHIRYKNKKDKYFDKYHFIYQNTGLQNIELPIPVDATGAFTITRIYLKNNQLHRTEKRYHLPESSKSLEIIVEKFRTTLTPGAKEEFVVSVKAANKKAVAELMTTMYDASLDKLQEHSWQLPEEGRGRYVTSKWFTQINEYSNSSLESTQPAVVTRRSKLWWRPNEYLYPILYDYVILNSVQEEVSRTLSGRVAGIQVLNTPGLEEVIVVGYGVSKALNSTSAIQIRGSINWNAYANSLIIIDGVPYTEDLSKIDFSTIKNGVILKSAEATALYGSRAANGVVLLSTTGVVQLPSAPPPPVLIRKSFNETAFFHPQLPANKKGLYQIRFTLPQTATEWKWKVLAHTPDARFQYLEKSIFSKLPLMVLPDLPRFVYQGDSIEISTRVANLDTTSMTVLLTCELLDELTGENITHLFLKDSLQTITVGAEQTNYGTFKVSIPDQFLHPVRIKFIGRSATYSDGEEHLLPILSKKQLIRQSVELNEMNSSSPIYPPVLPSDAIPFGIGLSIAEQPQAALINSLPGLANYSFNCAEQTTNKMLAHLVAVHLVKKELLTATETTTNQSISNEKAGNLPAGTRSAAMPWLELTEKQQLLQKQLKLLTDTAQSIEKAGEYLKEIIDMQLKNGALPWFKSGDPDLFISNYVLGSFGKMQKDGYLLPLKKKELEDINQFLQNLIRFCDNAINTNPSNFNEIDYLYARSFHHNRYPLADSAVAKLLAMYHFHWKKVASYSYSRQAKLITATLNYFKTSDSCYQEALALLEFIRQAGITDPAKGIRWKIISNYDELNSTQEELLADLQEAFNSSEKYPTVSQGILQWILQDRNSHEWRSTKGAASMIYQLATTPYNDRANQTEKTIVYDQQKLSVSNGIATGSSTTFLSVQEKSFKGLLQEHTQGKPQPAQVHYYYFSANTAVNESNNTIQLNKHLERWDAQKNTWVNVDSSTICIVGDRIRIKIQLTTKKPLQYLVLNERHPATMEPVEVLSGMRYSNDFFYYCSVRDIGHHFFISSLPTGTSEIMYEMKLTKPGNFNSGIYSIQAMYQPAIQTSGPSYKLIVNSSQSKADQ